MFIKNFNRDVAKMLVSCGVPAQDLPPKKTIDIAESLVKIEPEIKNMPTRVISTSRQFKVVQSLIEHPLQGSYTVGISSFPSDSRAKYLAQTIMASAIKAYTSSKRRHGRSLPLWHRVYGGFSDSLRDAKSLSDMPCMLIISNVGDTSSAIKLEKVRDLLERYVEIPRIVVMGGEPPCNLFANKLHYPMKAGIYLGPEGMIHED